MSRPSLSIVIPVYDDHEGLLFTCESLALYQDLAECELLVVDNHPDSDDGKATRGLVEGWLKHLPGVQVRYLAVPTPIGPGCSKDRAVQEAAGQAVLCLDSHVLLAPGSIARLREFYATHPGTQDLFTGPLLSNRLDVIATHFADVWRGEMWGVWAQAWSCSCGWDFDCREVDGRAVAHDLVKQSAVDGCPKCGLRLEGIPWANHERQLVASGCRRLGQQPDAVPFEIPAMGMGLFSCRKDAWLGFAEGVEGFGAEEFCIHGRYRQNGHSTFSLPFLRWWHRFARKVAPYPLPRYAKVRNYVLEFAELGWDLAPIYEHFVASGLLPETEWQFLIADPVGRKTAPAPESRCGSCGSKTAVAGDGRLLQPPAGVDVATLFDWACNTTTRDLNEHLPKLRESAAGLTHVTEITKRRESTVAFVAAAPRTLVSYQRERDPLNEVLHKVAQQPLAEFTQHVGDHDGVPAIAETDLLFIDDVHTFDRLFLQLSTLAPRVRKRIAMHDTATYGERGDGGGPGLMTAIRKFMKMNPEWSVVYHTGKQYGLTIISRDPADKPKRPSMARMAVNFSKAMAAHLANGLKAATEEQVNARVDVCTTCEQRTGEHCSVCGCPIEAKASLESSECPLGRWPA